MEFNPRIEQDNIGTMVCFHGRYDLGDKHKIKLEAARQVEHSKEVIALPLYLYDHSGLTMNTTGFTCPFDSGQVGFIYVSKKNARNVLGWSKLTKDRIQIVKEYLVDEVEQYSEYLEG